ncbi:MAG: replicative DNA helicase [Chitinophagaceae bacterium]|nr:MAG: replicative DNA helicase [Chitinophagaceae bacterium]
MELTNYNKDQKQRKKISPDMSTMLFGKVPPQAKDLEEAVLGAILIDKSAFDEVSELLKPECFYVEAHSRIFTAMQGLAVRSYPIDILTVSEELKKKGELDIVGGAYYITKLTNSVVSSAHTKSHTKIVLQKFIQRELIRISGEIIGDAYEDSKDVFDLLDDAEKKLFEITNNHLRKNFSELSTVIVDTIKRIDELRSKNEDVTGVPTGFPSLDKITHGWQNTDFIVLAARPGVGKTAFALNLARNAARHPTKPTAVGFFSLEMSAAQLVQRLLSAESEILHEKIARGKMEDHEMKQLYVRGIQPLSHAPIYIDDTAAINIFDLRAKCRRLKNKHDVGMIFVDYLQLMSGSSDNKNVNREQEISNISRNLKAIAKELSIPIFALSQLNRETEKRADKMPQLSDMRESGAIEQDADMVIFLVRPDYNDITTNEQGEDIRGQVTVRIAKHRNGSTGDLKLKALLHIYKFIEYDDAHANIHLPGNYRSVSDTEGNRSSNYIQTGSKMNNLDTDEEPF